MLFATVAAGARGQRVKVWVSSNGGDRMAAKEDREFGKDKGDHAAKANFSINGKVKYQRMEGFGASIMEAGLMTLNTLPAEKQEEVLRALFDPKDGAGFTAMKTPLAGTDFQSAGPWFTYDDTPGDVELKNFSVERDFGPNGVGTYILRARKYGNFALQAPMDYPPDWMLYDVKKRQDIPPKYYPVLANYFVKYLEEYKKRGIVVDYLSLFNEPEEVYTKIKYPEIRVLIRDHVGPALAKSTGSRPAEARTAADDARSVLEDIIRRGARSGAFAVSPDESRDQARVVFFTWSVVHGLSMALLDGFAGTEIAVDDLVKLVERAVLDGLRPRKGRR